MDKEAIKYSLRGMEMGKPVWVRGMNVPGPGHIVGFCRLYGRTFREDECPIGVQVRIMDGSVLKLSIDEFEFLL